MRVLTQQRATALSWPGTPTGPAAWCGAAAEPRRAASGALAGSCMDGAEFVELQALYRPTGGMAHGEELAARLHVDGSGGYARLARWIVGGQVFSFSWNEHFWLPMFQFNATDLAPHHHMRLVLAELMDVMDGRALAHWFTQPNASLCGFSPVAMRASQWPDVFHAARLQRFVITG